MRCGPETPPDQFTGSEEDEDPDHDVRWLDPAERPRPMSSGRAGRGDSGRYSELPPDQRITLILSDIEGLDYQEIADATNTALGTVKSRLSRARARLRELLLLQTELLPSQFRQ